MVRHLEALILGTVDDMAGYPIVMARDNSDLQVVSTTTETAVLEYTCEANKLSGDHGFRVTMNGFSFNDTGSNITTTFRVKLGATTLYALGVILGDPGTAHNAPVRMVLELMAKNADNAQELFLQLGVNSGAAPTTGEGTIAGGTFPMYGSSAEDCTVDQVLTITVELSTSSANASFTRRQFLVEYL